MKKFLFIATMLLVPLLTYSSPTPYIKEIDDRFISAEDRIYVLENTPGGGTGTVTSVGSGTGLTGGPITSSGTLSLANTAVSAGSYGSQITVPTFTVDAQGRLTAASNNSPITAAALSAVPTTRTLTAGTGLSGGGDLSADRSFALADTAVTPGAYTAANITIDAQGRITSAANGATGSNNSIPYFNGTGVLSSDANAQYSTALTQFFPPFAVNGFFAKSDVIDSAFAGFVFGSLDTSTDSFTTNAGLISGSNTSVGATNATGGVLFGTGAVSDAGASANTGSVNIFTGGNAGSGSTGGFNFFTGQADGGSSGGVQIGSGETNTANSGSLVLFSGQSQSGNSGPVSLISSQSATGATGSASLRTGLISGGGASTDTGDVNLSSGNNAGTGNSGAIVLTTGTINGGTRGKIKFVDGSEGTIGHVWTSTGTGGEGAWAAASGGGANVTLSNLTSPTAVNEDLIFDTGAAAFLQTEENLAGTTQEINVKSGNADGASGNALLNSGDSATANTGHVILVSGSSNGASGNTGTMQMTSGGILNAASTGLTGDIDIGTGENQGTNNSGGITLHSGDAVTGDSGNINITAGTAAGTRGQLILNAGNLNFTADNVASIDATTSIDFNGGSSTITMNGAGIDLTPAGAVSILGSSSSFAVPQTITAGGTTGDQTIDKISGTVNFAAAASALTVTDARVTANSIILSTARTNDATCSVKNVVPGSGSFVINMTAACTAETSVGFFVLN